MHYKSPSYVRLVWREGVTYPRWCKLWQVIQRPGRCLPDILPKRFCGGEEGQASSSAGETGDQNWKQKGE